MKFLPQRHNVFFSWLILVAFVATVFTSVFNFGLNLPVAHAAGAKRIILDTDIGTDVDDAIALSLAAASPEFDIVGVTTVHADAQLRARIARKILKLAGREDIPVIAGFSIPLKIPLPENFTWMPSLRGHEGAGILNEEELVLTKDLNATADDAANFIIEKAKEYKGELSLITVGTLSNVGRALQIEPQLADWIKEIVLVGGTVYAEKFPFPPMLETNLNADPGASEIVFASGIPITIVPMEITTQVFLNAIETGDSRPIEEFLRNYHDIVVTAGGILYQKVRQYNDLSKRHLERATVATIADLVVYNHQLGNPDAEVTRILRTKRRHPALHQLSTRRKLVTNADDKYYAFLKTAADKSERILVVLNYQSSPQTIDIDMSGVATSGLLELKSGELFVPKNHFKVELPVYGKRFHQVLPPKKLP